MKVFSPAEVWAHFEMISRDAKPNLEEEIHMEGAWTLVEIDPDDFGDCSNEELNGARERQARAYSKLKTEAPAVIARRLADGSYEALDGRRRVRAAKLRGSPVLAFVPAN